MGGGGGKVRVRWAWVSKLYPEHHRDGDVHLDWQGSKMIYDIFIM